MLSAICSIVLFAAPAPANAAPPTPQSAARIAVTSIPPPRASTPPRRGEVTWLPSTYSLSRDPGFTPWTSFFSLGHDGVGRWTLEGTSLGGGLRCGDLRDRWCQPLAFAMFALVWQPDDSPVAFVAGPSLTSVPVNGEMRVTPGFSAGLRITTASLAAWVKRRRRD
jgi:hypothetical protein